MATQRKICFPGGFVGSSIETMNVRGNLIKVSKITRNFEDELMHLTSLSKKKKPKPPIVG